MPRDRTKPSTPQTPEEKASPPMRSQSHGGSLRTGGTNKSGPGPTPSTVRAKYREFAERRLKALEKTVDMAEKIMDKKGKATSDMTKLFAADRIHKAIDVAVRAGGVASVSITDSDGNDMTLPPMIVNTTPAETPANDPAARSE